MGLHIWPVDADGTGRAGLFDSVTERALALPLFSSVEAAEGFLLFAREHGFGCDLRACDDDMLDGIREQWIAAGAPEVAEDDDDESDADLTPLLQASLAIQRGRRART